ncbi:MAG: hypothetical protein ABJM36_02025 [Algibacter sp.]|uniref:hypothetical protein n=1 Tax=Algibacter sp. TaxID=1872428 RepID=UPI0032985BAA
MLKKLTLLFFVIAIVSCNSDNSIPDCSTVLCAAPFLSINLIDTDTNENFVLNNNITEESIEIQDENENTIEFTLIESNGLLYVEKDEDKKGILNITINEVLAISFGYDTTLPLTNACCDFGELKNIVIENKLYEIEGNTIIIYL